METTVASRSPDAQPSALPAPLWRILLFGALALTAGTGLAYLATRSHHETYAGTLTARVVPITADRAGVISQWHVAEGESLLIGQSLASMADPTLTHRRRELDSSITRLQAELDRAIAKADLDLDWRMKDVTQTIFAARLQSAEYLEEKHLHEMEKVALTDLLTHGSTAFVASNDTVVDSLVLKESNAQTSRLNTVLRLEAATNATEVCTAQVELCDEQVEWLEELKETLPERVRKSVGVDMAEQELETAQAERDELEDAVAETTIASPAIGRAGVFFKRVGDYVTVGEPIVEVLDDSQRLIAVDVPSEKVAGFTIGREVSVIFPGDVRRAGRVIRVAPQAVSRGDASGIGSVVRIHIEQAGVIWPTVPIGAGGCEPVNVAITLRVMATWLRRQCRRSRTVPALLHRLPRGRDDRARFVGHRDSRCASDRF